MSKITRILSSFIMLISLVLILSSCIYDTDNEVATKNIERLLTLIEKKDKVGIKICLHLTN